MITLSVPDMFCAHCKAAVEKALCAAVPESTVAVDLAARTVRVSAEADPQTLLKRLDDVGYPARIIAG